MISIKITDVPVMKELLDLSVWRQHWPMWWPTLIRSFPYIFVYFGKYGPRAPSLASWGAAETPK